MRPLAIAATCAGVAVATAGVAAYAVAQGGKHHVDPKPPDPVDPPVTPPPVTPPPGPKYTVKTDHAGFEAAVSQQFAGRPIPEHELKLPPEGTPVRGVMVAIHGGAWVFVGPGMIRAVDGDVARWNERGFATVNIDYRAGADSMTDVLSFYDAVRNWQGADVPIAATGQSAGGHLSMYIAAHRPDVSFVVSNSGPSDLGRLAGKTAASVAIQEAVRQLFGNDKLASYSPAVDSARLGTRMLVANAANDELVLPDQAHYMQQARPDLVESFILDAGDQPYTHSNVSAGSLATLHEKEARLADESIAAAGG